MMQNFIKYHQCLDCTCKVGVEQTNNKCAEQLHVVLSCQNAAKMLPTQSVYNLYFQFSVLLNQLGDFAQTTWFNKGVLVYLTCIPMMAMQR